MKHLLILCITLLCSITAWSQNEGTNIKFMKGERGEDLRSIVIEPTASHRGNTIFVFSEITMSDIQVTVKDITGNVVYTNTIMIPAKGQYSFTLDNVESGDYILEVTYGGNIFYGYFTL